MEAYLVQKQKTLENLQTPSSRTTVQNIPDNFISIYKN